jgi:hypothetical protein
VGALKSWQTERDAQRERQLELPDEIWNGMLETNLTGLKSSSQPAAIHNQNVAVNVVGGL